MKNDVLSMDVKLTTFLYDTLVIPLSLITMENVNSPNPSFIKLAMRNMVAKGRQSLFHFGLTAIGFFCFILVLAWVGRPNVY